MDFTEERAENWDHLWKYYSLFQTPDTQWIFRGLPNADYELKTSLERVRERFEVPPNDLRKIEAAMLRHYKRQAHRYLENLPTATDTIEWLALMRHFGSPTRLIDWTYSFFVGLFFAVEEAEESCALWALDMDWLRNKARPLFDDSKLGKLLVVDPRLKSGEFFDLVFNKKPPHTLVYSLNPERLNERVIAQQGIFLAPANISASFIENLDAVCQTDVVKAKSRICKITIKTPVKFKKEILRHLYRMNINRATLFPGLGGFAESLATSLAYPDILEGQLP